MQIAFERSGGFAAMILSTKVDIDALGVQEAEWVRHLVETANFFQLPSHLFSTGEVDRFQYQLTVTDGDRHHTVTIGETAIPESLHPLIDWLLDKARQ